ncbi:MAG: hypothetical protein ACOC2P_01380 [Spirochaetota bacterium]
MFSSYYEVYEMELGRREDVLQRRRIDSRVQQARRHNHCAKGSTNLLAKISSALLQLGSFGCRE